MRQIVIYFWQMCLLKTGPQKLPRSSAVLALIFLTYLCVAIVTVSMRRPDLGMLGITGSALLGVSTEAAIVWLLLAYKQVQARFTATMSALLGTNTIILLILMPLNTIILSVDTESTLAFFTELASLVCLGWWLAIAGAILHHAVNISILQGAAVVFVMEIVAMATTLTVYPLPT